MDANVAALPLTPARAAALPLVSQIKSKVRGALYRKKAKLQ
ncbi:MAG TPA: hypothetical protein PKD98_27295 [Anaerolineae bacterium]|nr:hypothetical protein [Anaerolineae bacterium]